MSDIPSSSSSSSSLFLLLSTALIIFFIFALLQCVAFFTDLRRRMSFLKTMPSYKSHWLLGHVADFPGPNESGLTWLKERSAFAPKGIGLSWYGPFFPVVATFHPNTVKAILKTSDFFVGFLWDLRRVSVATTASYALAKAARHDERIITGVVGRSRETSVRAWPSLTMRKPKPRQWGGYTNIYRWLGDGLLLTGGAKWARNRRLLTPAFHFDILRPYMVINNRSTDVFLSKLEEFSRRGEYFEMSSHVSHLTLDIILRCAFSYVNDCQLKGEDHPYVQAIHRLAEAAVYRLLRPWLYPEFIFNLSLTGRQFNKDCDFVHQVSDEIIRKRKETLSQENAEKSKMPTTTTTSSRYLDFLDILLTAKDDNGQGLSDLEIRDEVDTFLFEGHDTTSSGISWALYSLAKHPEHQAICQREIDEILAEKENKDIEWDDLSRMTHLTMCLKESLRMHCPVPFIQRQVTRDLEVEGHTVPAGTVVDVHLYILHHNKLIWEDPEEFRPERFSAERSNAMDSYAFVPFSAGPRNCIGQHFAMHEMKTAIAKILSRFTLSLDPSRPVEHRIVVVMKTERGMYMKATPRHFT